MVERQPQEGRSGEIRRLRIGETAGIGLDPGGELIEIRRRPGYFRRVVFKYEPGFAVGRLVTFGGVTEIGSRRLRIDERDKVRQFVRRGSPEQIGLPGIPEILAVDPQQIDNPFLTVGLFLGQKFVDEHRCIHGHPFQCDIVFRLQAPGHHHVDPAVDFGGSSPHIKAHFASPCGFDDFIPAHVCGICCLTISTGIQGLGTENEDECDKQHHRKTSQSAKTVDLLQLV